MDKDYSCFLKFYIPRFLTCGQIEQLFTNLVLTNSEVKKKSAFSKYFFFCRLNKE